MAQWGHIALLIAFVLSSCAIPIDLMGKWRKKARLIRAGRNATITSFACVTAAVTIIVILLVESDFADTNVARTHLARTFHVVQDQPAMGGFRIAVIVAVDEAGFVTIVFGKCTEDHRSFYANARVIANLVCVFFLLVLTFEINLFAASEIAVRDGARLDPRLQHPATALHLPILLIGYAASAVPFAWSFAWLKWHAAPGSIPLFKRVRNWILSAWLFLTIGVVLGAWSACEEFGWKDYCFWNVAQNFSLVPWLPATALLCGSRIFKRNAVAVKWIVPLSLITFSSCILTTFVGQPDMPTGARKLFIILLIHLWALTAVFSWRRYRRSSQSGPTGQSK